MAGSPYDLDDASSPSGGSPSPSFFFLDVLREIIMPILAKPGAVPASS